MNNPVQINNEEQDTVEMPIAEYEAIVTFSTKIAEQNALVLKSLETLRGEMVAQAETQTANMGAFLDAFKEMVAGLNIVVNVPQQPAPVVNVPPAEVTVKLPPEKKRKTNLTVRRDQFGAVTGIEGQTE